MAMSYHAKREAEYKLREMESKRRRMDPKALAKLKALGGDIDPADFSEEYLNSNPIQKDFSSSIHHQKRSKEEISQYLEENELNVEGEDVDPVIDFEEVDFGKKIKKALSTSFQKPTPIQAQSWPIILKGRDIIGLAKTGSGKTLAFALPGILHWQAQTPPTGSEGPVILVLGPTRELVLQIATEVGKFKACCGIRVGQAYGGQDAGGSRTQQAAALVAGVDFLAACPGRLIDFLEAGVCQLKRSTYVVLDEADQMLDMGFIPQIQSILSQTRPDRQTLMFSATWEGGVKTVAKQFLNQPVKVIVNNSTVATANKDVKQSVVLVSKHEKKDKVLEIIAEVRKNFEVSRTLIFVNRKWEADEIAGLLYTKYPGDASAIHGDLSQSQREGSLQALRVNPKAILVATDVASRGLDIKDLACVINFDLPNNIASYVHRIGRTGRAGKKGVAYTLFTYADAGMAGDLAKVIKEAGQEVPEELEAMAGRGGGGWGGGGRSGGRGGGGWGKGGGKGKGGWNKW
jgi:ATP-dependent RNA helicase DDX5/DBP2